jgi:lysophospholipase L1-like esterase
MELRKYILIIVLLVLAFSGNAQTDSSYKTSYYEQKVTMFRLLPDTKNEIIFLGNSITDIAEWAEIWQNKNVKNRGISTDNTFGVLARLDEVLSSKPDKIFLMIGINDIARGTPDGIIIRNHKRIYDRVKQHSPKTKLFVQSILPTNNTFKEFVRYQNKEEHIRNVNTALKQICQQRNLIFIDLYSRFTDNEGRLSKEFTNDGVHINGYGYMLWKKILQEKKYL